MPLIETSRAAMNPPLRGKKLTPVMREFAVSIRLKTWTSLFCASASSMLCPVPMSVILAVVERFNILII